MAKLIPLSTHAKERGTYVITVAFTDEDGNAEDIKTLVWSLTDLDGNAINSRTDVAVADPGTSVDIVLSGADLATNGEAKTLELTVEATYDSALGSDLPLHGSCRFVVDDLKADVS